MGLVIATGVLVIFSVILVFMSMGFSISIRKSKRKFPPGNYALISVADKTGIESFAERLHNAGWYILSSGGTAKIIAAAGIPAIDVADLVGGGPILGDRVKTLSREVHAGLLSTMSANDVAELEKLGIPRIGVVCVDTYDLESEIANPEATLASVTEKTDIGGPAILRSGSKGRRVVICDPTDREWVLDKLLGSETEDMEVVCRGLAAKAEFFVSRYALASARYLGQGKYEGFLGVIDRILCYGENRRQKFAAFFRTKEADSDPLALDKMRLIEGRGPSFINMTDVHRLLETAVKISAGWELNFGSVPKIALAVKHGGACGVAVGSDPYKVICNMVRGDPEAISGGLVITNFQVNEEMARLLRSYAMPAGKKRILDSVFAPGFTTEAIEVLARRKTGKCRLFVNPALATELGCHALDTTRRFRQVRGGFLVQDGDAFILMLRKEWQDILTTQQKRDLVLGWAIGSTSNSNTIVLTKNDMLLGVGKAENSRVMAARVAVLCAQNSDHSTKDAMGYSDSFFPYPDGPEVLADAGVSVIFATSGSVNDDEVAEACEKMGVTLLTIPDAEARGFYGH